MEMEMKEFISLVGDVPDGADEVRESHAGRLVGIQIEGVESIERRPEELVLLRVIDEVDDHSVREDERGERRQGKLVGVYDHEQDAGSVIVLETKQDEELTVIRGHDVGEVARVRIRREHSGRKIGEIHRDEDVCLGCGERGLSRIEAKSSSVSRLRYG